MYCEPRGHHGHGRRHCGCSQGHHGGSCECGGGFGRRFLTKEERITGLQEYLENLRKEAQAVEERIAELQGA